MLKGPNCDRITGYGEKSSQQSDRVLILLKRNPNLLANLVIFHVKVPLVESLIVTLKKLAVGGGY